ncbi:MAG: tRNA (N(6)-L-threonylcarbamoyladenosine(37)-C(2))-methylthiotransferase MtaB [Bacteroidales bacterium]|nr:tRNA (N(6)-L-threonylcarbamoyladenosine(37)-C(2))-methylthiotransferase MtaB [Bacteroidales bacterium]MBP5241595.1 tRNA (N(6)-L-threonylcarbamoyladenosine(37)-C(2))-methylthiotransferase MtaB [Bacteroidales bacterium]
MKRVAVHTLGCKLNFSESSDMVRQFVERGFEVVDFRDVADVYIINTCTVTSIAEKKCRTAIHQAVAANPDAIVGVVGCFSQVNPQEISKIEGVDIILGNADKHRLAEYVLNCGKDKSLPTTVMPMGDGDEFVATFSTGDRTRSFFKVQDGCDYFCTYCEIPFARGRSRSQTVAETVAKTRQIAATGVKEIVLTGINTGEFGKQHGESFFQLIKELDHVEEVSRYRISSIEPNLLTDEMIDFIAQSRAFLPHFHIPLQAGSNAVLQLMKRRYTTQLYAARLQKIKSVMPDACIAADVIVGFNGETDEEFANACRFIESLPISYLHVFTYSERPRTKALAMDGKVPVNVRRERSKVLHDISDRKKAKFYKENYGTTHKVLWESDLHDGFMLGFTENYIRVKTPFVPTKVNTIESVVVSEENVFI